MTSSVYNLQHYSSSTVNSEKNSIDLGDVSAKCREIPTDDKYFLFLENIRNEIEKMDKIHHIRVLKILKKYKSIKLNENKSGIFVNLSFLPREAIETLVKYIEYIKEQENYILNVENKQECLKTLLDTHQNKDI
jgi:hypothetical protein